MEVRTVYSLVEHAANTWGSKPALYQPLGGKIDNQYKIYTWIDYRQIVEEIAAGLRQLGVQMGDVVALHSETRAEFYLADTAVMTNGSISAALYSSYPADNLVRTLRACDAKVVFAENTQVMRELSAAAAGSPLDVQWILIEGESDGAISFSRLRELGAKAMSDDPSLFRSLRAEVKPDDSAILYLTSGATGEPKMGLVSHRAVLANLEMGPKAVPLGPQHRSIAFLPSAHITQRVAMQLLPLRVGMPVWFSAGLSTLPHELKEIRPTFFVAPPRVWERIYASICTEIRKRGAFTRKLFYGALGLGLEHTRRKQAGQPIPGWLKHSIKLADRLVFRKIRERFGNCLELPISGAAPLGKELAEFYAAVGMSIYEGYGLTEGGIVCLNPVGRPVSGSIGKPLSGVCFRIADDGELLIQSPTLFSGYYKDPDATAAVMRNGWLYTGDIGEIDRDGYVYITGRKKEVLVSSNGKKIYPPRIESLFKVEPMVNQVLLLGDKMPYVAALLTLNPQAVESLPGMKDASRRPMAEIANSPVVHKAIKQLVARVNSQLADFERIKRWHVLDRDFTIADGELTPTMKIRRTQVFQNHQEIIDTLYKGQGPKAA